MSDKSDKVKISSSIFDFLDHKYFSGDNVLSFKDKKNIKNDLELLIDFLEFIIKKASGVYEEKIEKDIKI